MTQPLDLRPRFRSCRAVGHWSRTDGPRPILLPRIIMQPVITPTQVQAVADAFRAAAEVLCRVVSPVVAAFRTLAQYAPQLASQLGYAAARREERSGIGRCRTSGTAVICEACWPA
jgi:hypothetical protein